MKTKTTQFCALIAFMALLANMDPILLASDLTFQRVMQTQATLIQHEATERQRKIAQAHAVTYFKHLPPEKKVAIKKNKKTRYIAVDTEKNAQTSPKAKKVVMVWDTQSESLVGNTVYDLPDPPPVGKSIVFTTYAAEYVGGSN